MKVLIFGAGSQVGLALGRLLAQRHIQYATVADDLVNSSDRVLLKRQLEQAQAGYVIHCQDEAVWLGQSETEVKARLTSLARVCNEQHCALLLLSSGQVFDGKKSSAYSELDEPNPTTRSGHLYQLAEAQVVAHCERHLILRSTWIFGPDGDNWLTRILAQAKAEASLQVADNERGCPTAAEDVARVIIAILLQVDCEVDPPLWGIYHYAGSDVANQSTFVETVIKAAKSYMDVSVESVETLPPAEEARERMINTELSSRKVLNVFGVKQHPWRRGVQDSLKQLYDTHV